ncbi:MAG: hypothetical protein J7K61_04695 [Thermoplasmata archaeon]|nr:hypothetical protein [Thermoplasmata archaeon]
MKSGNTAGQGREGRIKRATFIDYLAIIGILIGIFIAIIGNWIGGVIFALAVFLELWSMIRR